MKMLRLFLSMSVVAQFSAPVFAQTAAAPDPWTALKFLEGTWAAQAKGQGVASGRYTFRRELDGHVLARHSSTSACKAHDDVDCEHADLLYVFEEAPGRTLKAIYFDSEGHVIHYTVGTPTRDEVEFLSEPAPGPRFRLVYTLKGTEMTGRFQMQAPDQRAWNSYLEWSGAKQ